MSHVHVDTKDKSARVLFAEPPHFLEDGNEVFDDHVVLLYEQHETVETARHPQTIEHVVSLKPKTKIKPGNRIPYKLAKYAHKLNVFEAGSLDSNLPEPMMLRLRVFRFPVVPVLVRPLPIRAAQLRCSVKTFEEQLAGMRIV